MTKVITRKGQEGTLVVDTKAHKAILTVEGVAHLIAYIRDNKVKIKNDMLLSQGDLNSVRLEMNQFVRVVDNSKKRK